MVQTTGNCEHSLVKEECERLPPTIGSDKNTDHILPIPLRGGSVGNSALYTIHKFHSSQTTSLMPSGCSLGGKNVVSSTGQRYGIPYFNYGGTYQKCTDENPCVCRNPVHVTYLKNKMMYDAANDLAEHMLKTDQSIYNKKQENCGVCHCNVKPKENMYYEPDDPNMKCGTENRIGYKFTTPKLINQHFASLTGIITRPKHIHQEQNYRIQM